MLLMAYIYSQTGKMPAEWAAPKALNGLEILEAIWPLNEVFRPHLATLKTLSYDSAYETKADEAIKAYLLESPAVWETLEAPVLRVLAERHLQTCLVCATNQAAGNLHLMAVPQDLPEGAHIGCAMLYWLHAMKLPYPPTLVSDDAFPSASARASEWRP
jgi:hypothetical protein